MSEKRDLKRDVRRRRNAALATLAPQWRRCFWTRPFGHVRDGTREARNHYENCCLYCGRPSYGANSLVDLEDFAARVHEWPVASGHDKRTVTA